MPVSSRACTLPEHVRSEQRTCHPSVHWGVEDIEAEYKRLLELGAKPHKPIEDVGGGIKVAVVLDPSGNPFGIIFNPNFELP